MTSLRSCTVLMYHAIGAGEAADPHYTVSLESFHAQLALLRLARRLPASVASILAAPQGPARVGVTFDDGHDSNAAAARDIADAGGSADFFVNPSTVGTRHFLSWAALRDLCAAGMSVQSHGQTHRYFDAMAPAEAQRELADSKREIEDRLGRPVTLFAPPGGRLAPGTAALARRVGYAAICSSRPRLWSAPGADDREIPRLAVLASTRERQFRRWIDQDDVELLRMVLRHEALGLAKRALGNGRYERMRARLLSSLPG